MGSPVDAVLVEVAVVFDVLALLAEVADLQRQGVRDGVFGGEVPLLNIGRLDVLRIDVEGAAVLGGAAGEALFRRARRSAAVRPGWRDAVTLTAWMNGVIEVRRWLDELPSKKLVAP